MSTEGQERVAALQGLRQVVESASDSPKAAGSEMQPSGVEDLRYELDRRREDCDRVREVLVPILRQHPQSKDDIGDDDAWGRSLRAGYVANTAAEVLQWYALEVERLTAEAEHHKRQHELWARLHTGEHEFVQSLMTQGEIGIWLVAESRELLRGMARRASFQRRQADRWHRRAEQEVRDRVTDTAKAMAESGMQRAEVSRLREQFATAVVLPQDADECVSVALNAAANRCNAALSEGFDIALTDAVMDVLRFWGAAPVSESVPATPHRDEGRPSGSGAAAPQSCACASCTPSEGPWRVIMHLCPQCGNKRCPGAKDHSQTCSGSNELGQPGSLYDFTEDRHLGQCVEDECLERREEGHRACEFHVNLPAAQAARGEATPILCDEHCPAEDPECRCSEQAWHRTCCHASASSSPPSGGDSDTTPRVWTVGDPEPDESVQTVRAANSQVFRRIWLRSVRRPLWQAGIGGQVEWAVMLGAVGPVTEVLSPSSLPQEGGTDD